MNDHQRDALVNLRNKMEEYERISMEIQAQIYDIDPSHTYWIAKVLTYREFVRELNTILYSTVVLE